MRGRNLNLAAFVLICGMILYLDLKKCHKLPWPPRFIFAGLTFALMELFSLVDETLSGVMSIGFVIAVALGTFSPQNIPGKLKVMAECEHGVVTTGQPQGTTLVGDVTTSAPDAGQGSMASVAEYQQTQPTQLPGTTLA